MPTLLFLLIKKKRCKAILKLYLVFLFVFRNLKHYWLCLYSYKLWYGTCKLALEKEKWLSNILFFPKKDIHNFRTCLTYTPWKLKVWSIISLLGMEATTISDNALCYFVDGCPGRENQKRKVYAVREYVYIHKSFTQYAHTSHARSMRTLY